MRNDAICSNMDGSRDYHTKWIKPKINIISYCLYVNSKRKKKFQNIETFTDIENKLMVTKGEREVKGGVNQGKSYMLGLTYMHCYIWSRQLTRTHYIAYKGEEAENEAEKYIYILNWTLEICD